MKSDASAGVAKRGSDFRSTTDWLRSSERVWRRLPKEDNVVVEVLYDAWRGRREPQNRYNAPHGKVKH
ncbi:hypothetical protein JZ751_007403 [Albula glossodonta]|uniref:Uncharacterized protein n=1 Tax=Albula glossodonta TaxID=121402 RepID=A0A8T2NA73_9TELE|nr:hypothetical protein JZ751_007403 [Albula glossodonta]